MLATPSAPPSWTTIVERLLERTSAGAMRRRVAASPGDCEMSCLKFALRLAARARRESPIAMDNDTPCDTDGLEKASSDSLMDSSSVVARSSPLAPLDGSSPSSCCALRLLRITAMCTVRMARSRREVFLTPVIAALAAMTETTPGLVSARMLVKPSSADLGASSIRRAMQPMVLYFSTSTQSAESTFVANRSMRCAESWLLMLSKSRSLTSGVTFSSTSLIKSVLVVSACIMNRGRAPPNAKDTISARSATSGLPMRHARESWFIIPSASDAFWIGIALRIFATWLGPSGMPGLVSIASSICGVTTPLLRRAAPPRPDTLASTTPAIAGARPANISFATLGCLAAKALAMRPDRAGSLLAMAWMHPPTSSSSMFSNTFAHTWSGISIITAASALLAMNAHTTARATGSLMDVSTAAASDTLIPLTTAAASLGGMLIRVPALTWLLRRLSRLLDRAPMTLKPVWVTPSFLPTPAQSFFPVPSSRTIFLANGFLDAVRMSFLTLWDMFLISVISVGVKTYGSSLARVDTKTLLSLSMRLSMNTTTSRVVIASSVSRTT
mmetsp:Transcript_42317/g.135459  ORF Transcript_42317/g.135459 Transcript_42317/m.135459 type:complete len:557 (-) Transcript_42317:910-2580(-)